MPARPTKTQSRNPLISVIVTVKDGAQFAEEGLRAILMQTITDFELIVVDDGSTDCTPDILNRLAREDPRIRVLILSENIRQAAASNRGLDIAQGTYIARTDADDIVDTRWLEIELAFLRAHPDIDLVGASMRHVTAEGKLIKKSNRAAGPDEIRWQMRFASPFAHNTIMFRRMPRPGQPPPRYDPQFFYADDYDFCARLITGSKGANLPDFLVSYRIHGASLSQTRWRDQVRDARIVATAFQKRELPKNLFDALEGFRRAAFGFEAVPAADILRGLRQVLAYDTRRMPGASIWLKRQCASVFYTAMVRSGRSKWQMILPFVFYAPGIFFPAVAVRFWERVSGRKYQSR